MATIDPKLVEAVKTYEQAAARLERALEAKEEALHEVAQASSEERAARKALLEVGEEDRVLIHNGIVYELIHNDEYYNSSNVRRHVPEVIE